MGNCHYATLYWSRCSGKLAAVSGDRRLKLFGFLCLAKQTWDISGNKPFSNCLRNDVLAGSWSLSSRGVEVRDLQGLKMEFLEGASWQDRDEPGVRQCILIRVKWGRYSPHLASDMSSAELVPQGLLHSQWAETDKCRAWFILAVADVFFRPWRITPYSPLTALIRCPLAATWAEGTELSATVV